MKSDKRPIEHHECPEDVARQLTLAGGVNRFGEPMFRVVWGWDRIVQLHGEWQEFERCEATLLDKWTGYHESRQFTRLKSSVIETREVPKYLPGNCWHLEMWRPPEEYGSPEEWGKAGAEKVGVMTVDTSGPYPERGEYELCYPLTDDGTSRGTPIPLVTEAIAEIVRMIVVSRERTTLAQRRAAIEQRMRREDDGFVAKTMDMLRDGMPAHHGETSIVVP